MTTKKEKVIDRNLRDHLLSLLNKDNAHLTFDSVVKLIPYELAGKKVEGIPYSCWEILEHMRISQWDILEFSRNADHVSPPHPEGYWP